MLVAERLTYRAIVSKGGDRLELGEIAIPDSMFREFSLSSI